jgi:hypothetical protein
MYQEKSLIMYRQTQEGKHWLTTLGFPPIQLPPVAANQRRVATFVTSVISAKLLVCEKIPDTLYLKVDDAISYGANLSSLGSHGVSLKLDFEKAAVKENDDFYTDEFFITPRPVGKWVNTYDDWVFMIARKLGMNDAPKPAGRETYELALAKVIDSVRKNLCKVREMYLQGLNTWNLYLKVGLLNNQQKVEYVWLKPLDWKNPNYVKAIIMSDPYDCDDYWLGQELHIPVAHLVDYCISNDSEHFVDSSLTRRVADDYGLMMTHL